MNVPTSNVVPKAASLLIITPPEPPGGGHSGTFAAFGEPFPYEIQSLHRAMHGMVEGSDESRGVQRQCATCYVYND